MLHSDADFRQFEEQKVEIADAKTQMQQMRLQMESYIASHSHMEEEIRYGFVLTHKETRL